MSSTATTLQAAGERRIHFVTGPTTASALLRFADPVLSYAVEGSAAPENADTLAVAVFPWGEAPETFATWTQRVASRDGVPPVFLKGRGVELWWSLGEAVLQCDAGEADALVTGIAEFEWYERILRGLEREVAAGWPALEFDKLVAFDATPADLPKSDGLGARMGEAFQRRIHFARVEPHLFAADRTLGAAAQRIGNELREKADFESRAEALDGHLEVFEHIYELASVRLAEFKAAHQGHHVEWIIIWLLVAEVALSLIQAGQQLFRGRF